MPISKRAKRAAGELYQLPHVSIDEVRDAFGAFEAEIYAEGDQTEKYRKALREILRVGERHVDEATGRRIADFNEAIKIAQKALCTCLGSQGGPDYCEVHAA